MSAYVNFYAFWHRVRMQLGQSVRSAICFQQMLPVPLYVVPWEPFAVSLSSMVIAPVRLAAVFALPA